MKVEYAVNPKRGSGKVTQVISTPSLSDMLYGMNTSGIIGARAQSQLQGSLTRKSIDGDFVVGGRILVKDQQNINRVVIGKLD